MEEGIAAALINGTALDCGNGYAKYLEGALNKKLITRKEIFVYTEIPV